MILPGMAMELSEDERTLQSFEISVKGLENIATTEARGTGSFGSVYEIEAHGLPCIAKCIHPVLIRYEQQIQGARRDVAKEKATIRQRFYEECLLLSKLRHPNIVQFMGVARVPNTGEMALITEALFSDLGNLVEQHKEISDPIKISLMLDVANGLLYLHSQSPPIIHRDLSAANVLVSEDLRGKIADLGVAKLLDHGYMYSGQQTAQPGAYAYMAPETLIETPRYDIKLDIFSFGGVLLYTINNEFPKVHEVDLSFDDVKDCRIQIAKRKSAINLAKGHCLLPLTLRCLHDKPEKRPNTKEVWDSVKCICIQKKRRKIVEIDKLQNDTEASLRDARNTISELMRQIATLRRQKSEKSQATKENRDLRRQLDEMKDRNTALEQQMMEYSTTVEDQAKSLKSGGGSAQLHQMHKQVQYSEAIESLRKKMDYTDKIAQESKETQLINVKLAGELEDYRSQTKRLIHGIQQKDQEIVMLRRALNQEQSPQQWSRGDVQQLNEVKDQLEATTQEKNGLFQNQEHLNTLEYRIRCLEHRFQASQKGKKPTDSDTNYKASLRDAPCTITELKRQMSTQMSQQSEKPQITKESRDMQAIPKSHKSYSYHGISSALSVSQPKAGPSEDDTTRSVQFMWQPLTDFGYITITLYIASFKGGSVDLKIDPDGSHYASQFTSIPKGMYEGQLVIGDSFMHPVKKFTVEKDNDIVVLQFEVQTSGDLDGSSYGGHYGSGFMQKNPSYNQASTHSSYSYHNPVFGHRTSSTLQGNYPEDRTSSGYHGEGYHYSAYGEPTLESASGSSYGRNRNVTPATHSSSSTKNGNAESELSGATNTPNSKDLIHDIYIPDAQSSGREGASKPKEKESGFNVRQLQQKRSRHEGDQRLHEAKAHLAIEAVTQQKNELLQKHSSGGQTGGDLDGSSYGGHYSSGYMQKNPSHNPASIHDPAFGHRTSSTLQGNYPEDRTSSGYHGEGYHYSAYGWPTLESASGQNSCRNLTPATHSSSSTKNRN